MKELTINRKIYLALFVSAFLSCHHASTMNEITLEVKEVNFIYTKPQIFTGYDSSDEFESYVFYQIEGVIKNDTKDSVTIFLNDLMSDNYSFDLDMQFDKKNIPFYNYPFSGYFYPIFNKIPIGSNDSTFINLQSPLIKYYKKINQKGIDSLFKLFQKSYFKVSEKNSKVELDKNKARFHLLPVAPKKFFSVNDVL